MASNNTTRDLERLEEEAGRLAYEQRIPFSDALAQLSGETPPPAKKKRTAGKKRAVSRADFEELREGVDRLVEMSCEREFVRVCEDGTIERRARERGIPHRDAWRECYEEAYRPLVESQQKRRELEQRAATVELEQRLYGEEA